MTKRLVFILIFIFLLALPVAFSQPPFQEATGSDTLEIRFPQVDFVKVRTSLTAHTHVFNRSNGLLRTNETVECIVHLYNSSGGHILQEQMAFDDNQIDFELEINDSIFTVIGDHSFLIQCNESGSGGFVSGMFEVTETGQSISSNNLLPIVITLISITVFFSLAGYYSKNVGVKIAATAVSLVGIVNLAFMIYLNESALPLTSMLRINFWITFLIIIGTAFIALIFLFMRALNLEDSMDTENKKWQGRK